MPCLVFSTRRWIAALPAVGLALAAGVAAAQGSVRSPTEAELVARAQAWLAGRHQVSAAAISVQPLDSRVQTKGCSGGWQFDQPFAGNDGTLRARCPDSGWQVFLQVILPARPAAAAPPAPAQAPAPAYPMGATLAAPSPPVPAPAAAVAPAVPSGPPLVRRGQTVLITWVTVPGLQVTARMEALDDGRMGETVRLRNRDSGKTVSATVTGQNQAQGQ